MSPHNLLYLNVGKPKWSKIFYLTKKKYVAAYCGMHPKCEIHKVMLWWCYSIMYFCEVVAFIGSFCVSSTMFCCGCFLMSVCRNCLVIVSLYNPCCLSQNKWVSKLTLAERCVPNKLLLVTVHCDCMHLDRSIDFFTNRKLIILLPISNYSWPIGSL